MERGKARCVETLRGSRGGKRGSARHAGEGEQQQRAAARTVNNQDAHARHHDLRNHHEHRAYSHGGAGEEREVPRSGALRTAEVVPKLASSMPAVRRIGPE